MLSLFQSKKRLAPLKLDLPKSWAALTTPQLEAVSKILIEEAKKYSLTGNYSQAKVFTRVFFALTGLTVISESETPAGEDDLQNKWFACEFTDKEKREQMQVVDGEFHPIKIHVWEIVSLTSMLPMEFEKDGTPKKPTGGLSWLNEKSNITTFPYPTLSLQDPSSSRRKRKVVEFEGPAELMQNFSWRQYRNASDYMNYLAKCENNLVTMRRQQMHYGSARIKKQEAVVKTLRAGFLATIFNGKVLHIDTETGKDVYDFFYVSSQSHDNERFFLDFPEEKFQAVSLWWQGMMNHLSRLYPKVFKSAGVGDAKKPKSPAADDPFALYTRSTTTMIKYAATNEEEVNRTTYTIILQHINDMAEENERIEAMKKK